MTCPRVHSFREVEPGIEMSIGIAWDRLSDSRTRVGKRAMDFLQKVPVEYKCAQLNQPLLQEPALKI